MNLFLAGFAHQLAPEVHPFSFSIEPAGTSPVACTCPATSPCCRCRHTHQNSTPIERVWLYLRERFLSHRIHLTYEDIVDAACRAWNDLRAENGRLASLTAYPWITGQ